MDYESKANHLLETVDQEKILKLAEKGIEKLKSKESSNEISMYDELLNRLSAKTGLSKEEVLSRII